MQGCVALLVGYVDVQFDGLFRRLVLQQLILALEKLQSQFEFTLLESDVQGQPVLVTVDRR